MIIKDDEIADVDTPTGKMRCNVFRPVAEGGYPGILLYSEIFQVTGPIRRTAAQVASQGFVVIVPEIYARFDRHTEKRQRFIRGDRIRFQYTIFGIDQCAIRNTIQINISQFIFFRVPARIIDR